MRSGTTFKTKPRLADRTPANGDRLAIIDRAILLLLMFAFTVLPAFLKMQSSDDAQNNSLKQVLWSLIYVACGIRLFQIRKMKEALIRLGIMWGFCGYLFLTAIWSVEQQTTILDAIELAGSTVVACYLAMRFDLRALLRFLAWIFGVTIFLSVVFLTVIRNHGYESWGAGGWAGFFAEKNALGASMSLGLITFSGLIFDSRGRRRLVYLLGFISCAVLLIGSNSVTSIFVVVIVGYILACVVLCRSSILARILTSASLLAMAVAYAAGASPNALIIAMGRTPNLSGRDQLWPYVNLAIADRPFFGYGYNAFFQSDLAKPFFKTAVAFNFHPYHAHNSFLQILVAGGYIGFTIFCLGLAKAYVESILHVLKSSDRFAFWPLGILLFLTIGSSDETYFPVINSFEWLALIAAALLTSREATGSEELEPLPIPSRALKTKTTLVKNHPAEARLRSAKDGGRRMQKRITLSTEVDEFGRK